MPCGKSLPAQMTWSGSASRTELRPIVIISLGTERVGYIGAATNYLRDLVQVS